MLHKKNLLIFMLSLFLSQAIVAAETMQDDNSYWTCSVYDSTENKWSDTSNYRRVAINKAYDACKKASKDPRSCKPAIENCEAFVDGMSTRPMWRCTALDFNAEAYQSNIYFDKYDAALAARAYCKDRSSQPGTCYIHTLTCNNLNSYSH